MSQRPSASRPASRSPLEGQRITLPPVQLREDARHGGRHTEMQPDHESRGYPQLPRLLTSPHPSTASEDWRSSGRSRDLAMHSILNPSEPDTTSSGSHHQIGGISVSPQSASTAPGPASHFAGSPSAGNTSSFTPHLATVSTPPIADSYRRNFIDRRILTPRSPRILSMGRMGGPGTIDAQQTPFLPARSRQYEAELGHPPRSEFAPGPSPPARNPQQQYRFTSAAAASVDRQASNTHIPNPGHRIKSDSASPSMSASSQNPSTQTSPASQYIFHQGPLGTPTSGSQFSGSSFDTAMGQGGGVQYQAPAAASGDQAQSTYTASQTGSSLHSSALKQEPTTDPVKVLTIANVTYHVPVDFHQASRLADEKRARNAGASARFRQRRKEKEKEASTNIEKLQQQNRDLERRMLAAEQERNFYRADRDRLRDLMVRLPGGRDMVLQGPTSPHSQRTGSFGSGNPQQQGSQSFQPSDSGERPTRRRRTDTQSEFAPMAYSLPPSTSLAPVQNPGYASATSIQAAPSLPPLRMDSVTQGGGLPNSSAPSVTTPGAQQPVYDLYARPYDRDRGWGPPGPLPPKSGRH